MSELPQGDDVAHVYVATCLYGLERVVVHELKEALGAEGERHWCEVTFPYAGDPANIAGLRVAGNVFLRFDRFRLEPGTAALSQVRSRLAGVPFAEWTDVWGRLQGSPPAGGVSVSVSREGDHSFTYAQVEEAAIEVLAPLAGRRVSLDPQPLELRIEIDGEWCRILGRVTARPLSSRDYRRAHMRGATDFALAAAMVRLSSPTPDDVFMDPFCGTGTVPIERALLMPAACILAGDLRSQRVGWTRTNAEAAGVTVLGACWDSFRLPLRDRAVTRLVTSPPQSDPATGRAWAPGDLAALLAESLRVLAYGGTLVWLMQRGPLFGQALKLTGVRWAPRHMQCSWRGRPWVINTLHKTL